MDIMRAFVGIHHFKIHHVAHDGVLVREGIGQINGLLRVDFLTDTAD